MELLSKDIHVQDGSEINIFFLGDIHEGSANHAEKEFAQAIRIIKDTENSYVFGMGDYIDAINHHDKRFNPSEIDPEYLVKDLKDLPVKQMNKLYTKIKPIQDKFLGLLYGNHEESYVKYNSFDPVHYLSNMMDVPKLGYTAIFRLGIIREKGRTRPNYNFIFDLNHGPHGGGGMREGSPVNKVHDVFRWTSGDVRVMGHIHSLAEDAKKFIEYRQGDNISYKTVWYGVSGCFMYKTREGTRGYFEASPSPHAGIGMLKCNIKIHHQKNACLVKLEKIIL